MSLDNLVGQTLAQYQLRELLGVGGMGAVYRAYQTNLKREVAVKIISPQLLTNTEAMARFIREAEVSAQLEHSNIVPIYDFGTQRGITYVVMRMLTGGSLSRRIEQRIEDGRPLISLGETADLLKQVASALDYAHSHGVVHRDIKPANIMFDNQGKPYVVDFGIAKITQGATSFTQTGMAMGTPNYMPPEQWRGEPPTPMADQYALAVMTYQLIAGRMPFEADSAFALMHKHINEQPTPLHVFRSDIPPAVIQVLNRAMAKDYRQRFQSCAAFAQAFESAIEGNKGNITGMFLFPVRPSQTGVIPISNRPYTPSNMPFSTQTKSNSKNWVVGGFVLTFMTVLIFIGILLAGNNGDSADSSSDATATVGAIVMIITETPEISPTPFPPEITDVPLEIATETPALDSRSIAQTLVAEENNATATSQALTATISAELTLIRQEQQIVNDTATASVWTETPSPTLTSTPSNTLTITATPMPSDTPTQTRLERLTATAQIRALFTPTDTRTPSNTPTVTLTRTPRPTHTPTATRTPIRTPHRAFGSTITASTTTVPPPQANVTVTRTPRPTSTPQPILPFGGILFETQFNTTAGIYTSGRVWGRVSEDNINIYCANNDSSSDYPRFDIGSNNWKNYSVEAYVRFAPITGSHAVIVILSHLDNQGWGYRHAVSQNGVSQYYFGDTEASPSTVVDLGGESFSVQFNTWYTLRAEVDGSEIRTYLNGRLIATNNDNRAMQGKIAIEVFPQTRGCVSQVTVRSLNRSSEALREAQKGLIIDDGVEIQFTPSSSQSSIGMVNQGTEVFILDSSSEADWILIYDDLSKIQGWVTRRSIDLVVATSVSTQRSMPTATVSPEGDVTVNVASANLRSGPGTNYGTVASASNGTSFRVIARTSDSQWYLIDRGNTERAWISASVVTVSLANSRITVVATIPAPPVISTQPPANQTTQDNQTIQPVTTIPSGFYSRPSEYCQTNSEGVCLGFEDGYMWYVNNTSGVCNGSIEVIDGYQIRIVNFCDGRRYAHILGTNYVKDNY